MLNIILGKSTTWSTKRDIERQIIIHVFDSFIHDTVTIVILLLQDQKYTRQWLLGKDKLEPSLCFINIQRRRVSSGCNNEINIQKWNKYNWELDV
jgi:hypothetical protein